MLDITRTGVLSPVAGFSTSRSGTDPGFEGCHQAGCAHLRPSWSHVASMGFILGEWSGQGSIRSMVFSSKKTDGELGLDEDVRYLL